MEVYVLQGLSPRVQNKKKGVHWHQISKMGKNPGPKMKKLSRNFWLEEWGIARSGTTRSLTSLA